MKNWSKVVSCLKNTYNIVNWDPGLVLVADDGCQYLSIDFYKHMVFGALDNSLEKGISDVILLICRKLQFLVLRFPFGFDIVFELN